jgi:ribosomal protein S18 acetylase RimI-like enzyme
MENKFRAANQDDSFQLFTFAITEFERNYGHLFEKEDLTFFFNNSLNHQTFIDWIKDPTFSIFIALDYSSNIIGYILNGPCSFNNIDAVSNSGEIKKMYVEPNHFGKGVANGLMTLGLTWLKRFYNGDLYVGVWCENHRAQNFYFKHGFKKISEFDFTVGKVGSRSFVLKYMP